MTLPNQLTFLRIFGVPLSVGLFYSPRLGIFATGYFLAFFFGITDYLDGYLARRLGQVSTLGKIIDPIADKIFVLLFCFYFVEIGILPAWFLILLIFRDLVISDFRLFAINEGQEVAVSRIGKIKAFSQYGLLGYLGGVRIYFFPTRDFTDLSSWPMTFRVIYYLLLVVVMALTMSSLLEYFWSNRKLLLQKEVVKS